MHNQMRIFITMSGIVLMFVFCDCRKVPGEPPIEEDMLAGKAFFSGPTLVSKHHGIQVIAYLKSDTTLTPIDTTCTDSTGYYSFGKPVVDRVYMVTAYYRYYYPDTIFVQFYNGQRQTAIPEMYIQQKARMRFSTEKKGYRIADTLKFSVEISNLTNENILLPAEPWLGDPRKNQLVLISKEKSETRFFGYCGIPHGHPGGESEIYKSGEIKIFICSCPISYFTNALGNKVEAGKYLFYAVGKYTSFKLEWNNRIMPIFEPAEVEIMP